MDTETIFPSQVPWNKGKIVGQKAIVKLQDIWTIRIGFNLTAAHEE